MPYREAIIRVNKPSMTMNVTLGQKLAQTSVGGLLIIKLNPETFVQYQQKKAALG